MEKAIDMVGKKYGKLTGIKRVKSEKWGAAMWLFQCDCGKTHVTQGSKLRLGYTKSCGCLRGKNLRKHGMYGTRLYRIWQGMLARCMNPHVKHYDCYGGRGISVCSSWKKFEGFQKDMEDIYREHVRLYGEKNTQINRVNNNGNYEKENCHWVTIKEQMNNTRASRYLTFRGEVRTLAQWSKRIGINYTTLWGRLDRGWSVEKALTAPLFINGN